MHKIFLVFILSFSFNAYAECQSASDRDFRKALNKCIRKGFYQTAYNKNSCDYECSSSYEEEISTFPDKVYIKTPTDTFNSKWYFILRNENIWAKSKTQENANWTLVKPHRRNYRPTEIASDDRNVISLDPDRKVYTMFGALSDKVEKFWWRQTWGLPFWFGGIWRIPDWVKSWSVSFFSPVQDVYHADTEGNLHHIGIGVTHIWMLNKSGQRIIFNDPWLPHDTSFETCSPLRGTFKSHKISTSGSKIFVINKYGDMYTKSYDFDMAGYNGVAFNYTYREVGPIITDPRDVAHRNREFLPRKLPVPDWVKQPKIFGVITDKISVHKVGKGGLHRILRVEGKNLDGVTGYFEKDADYEQEWKFIPTHLPLSGKILDNRPFDMSLETVGRDESREFSAEIDGFKVRVKNFHPYCTPSNMEVTFEDNSKLELLFHHRGQIRISKHSRGFKKKPKGFKGAIELASNESIKGEKASQFAQKYFNERFTDIEGKFTNKKILIESKKHFKWELMTNR